jgi:hypothetical protein
LSSDIKGKTDEKKENEINRQIFESLIASDISDDVNGEF